MNLREALAELIATLSDALTAAITAADLPERLASWWAVASGKVVVG